MTVNVFDRVLKILARHYAGCFLRLAVPEVGVELIGTLDNVELTLPGARVDFVHRVLYGGTEYLFHLEFQTEHEADMPERAFVYSAFLTQQFHLPVLTLVVYLRQRMAPLPDAYEVRVGEMVVNRFSYRVLRLWEWEEAIQVGHYRELAPLLVMLVKDPDAAVLQRERELIRQEPDAQKRADLLATAVMLAGRYFDREFLWRFFAEEVEQMKSSSFVEDWIEEGVERGLQQGLQQGLREGHQEGLQEGLQQGLQQGMQQATQAVLLRILGCRFGRLPIQFTERVESLTAGQMEGLVDVALSAEDLGAFEHELAACGPLSTVNNQG